MAKKPISRIGESIRRSKMRGPSQAKPGQTRPKPRRKVINIVERERIAQMHMMGNSNRRIARATGHARDSVAKIVAEADIPAYVAEVRGKFVGMGMLACTVIEKAMRGDKNPGNVDLAYKFMKDTGIVADVEGRAFIAKMAGVGGATPAPGEAPKQMLPAEARDLILASLSGPDRQIFRVLETFREKARAYGIPDVIDLPDHETPLNPYAKEEPPESPRANAKGA